MASVTGLVNYFIKGAVEGFSRKIAPVTAFAYAVEENAAGLNDVVRVPFVANASGSSTFVEGTGFTATSANGVTGKAVTLDTLMYQPIWLTDGDLLRLNAESIQKLGSVAGGRLASDFLSASLAATVTVGNFPNSSSYSSGQFTASVAALTLMKTCDDLHWPDDGRALVIPTDVYFNLLSNTAISSAEQYGNASAIQRGELPQIFGMTPYKTTTSIPGKGFVAHPSALAFAFAPFKPADEGENVVESIVAKDEKSGMVLTLRSWYDPTLACVKRTLCVLGGAVAVNSNAMVRIST